MIVEYIYLIQEKEFNTSDIYTLGKIWNKTNVPANIAQAIPKGATLLLQIIVKNCEYVFKDLLTIFSKKYIQDKSAYNRFQGNYQHMIDDIIKKQKEPPLSIDKAARKGDLDTINWWLKECNNSVELLTYSENAMDWASANGHTKVLDLLFKIFTSVTPWKLKYSPRAMDWAAAHGHIHVLEWWFNHHILSGIPLLYSKHAVDFAATQGHIHILEWFLRHSFKTFSGSLNLLLFDYSKNAIDFASIYGRIDVLDWFVKHAKCLNILKYDITRAIDLAAARGHTNVLNWWKFSGLGFNYQYAIDWASEEGHVNVLNWFEDNFMKNNQYLEIKYSEWAMNWASQKGHIHILNWFKYASEKYNIELKFSEHVMDWITDKKDIDVLNWWLNLKTTKPKYTAWSMNWASALGHIHILEWWLKVGCRGKPARLKYSKWAIDLAVFNCHIHVLEWWLQSGLPLKYSADIAYWPSSLPKEKQVKMYDWLEKHHFIT